MQDPEYKERISLSEKVELQCYLLAVWSLLPEETRKSLEASIGNAKYKSEYKTMLGYMDAHIKDDLRTRVQEFIKSII